MKKELKSGILSADKSADCRPTVGGVNVIADLLVKLSIIICEPSLMNWVSCAEWYMYEHLIWK